MGKTSSMTAYEIDGSALFPQPTSHQWESENEGVIGYDGVGKPIKRKYRKCTLRCDRSLGYAEWAVYDDAATHTVTLPAPDTANDWTDYTGCYVVVSHGRVEAGLAIGGFEMVVSHAEAY